VVIRQKIKNLLTDYEVSCKNTRHEVASQIGSIHVIVSTLRKLIHKKRDEVFRISE